MTSREIADIFSEIATLLELHGQDDFRVSAYRRASRALETTQINVAEAVKTGPLTGIPGIGKAMAAEVKEIVETGTSSQLKSLLEQTPPGLLEILEIRGLGAKKVRALHEQLGIETLGELEYACVENRVATLKGFGAKSQANILEGINELRSNKSKFRLDAATVEAEFLLDQLRSLDGVLRAEIAGSLRRGAEELDNISVVLASDENPETVADRIRTIELLSDVEVEGIRISGIADATFPVTIDVGTPDRFATLLHQRTGAHDYFFMISIPLTDRGYDLNDEGLFREDERIAVSSEEELFELAGMQYIPPELREGIDEVPRSLAGTIPQLVEADDMKGMLHVHSTWSDGQNSIAEIAEHVKGMGYSYLLMCDHSKAAFYANGLDEARLEKQGKEIDELNKKYDPSEFRILKGIECDILADGSMDLAEDSLAALDAVVASVHSSFNLPGEAQTERICNAVANRYTTILGHPTGRLLLARKGYDVDLKKVIETAAEHNKIIELNANPHRLDLSWRLMRFALKRGVRIAINPDAHSLTGFEVMRYGITIGRKGWLRAEDVVNTRTLDEFLALTKYVV